MTYSTKKAGVLFAIVLSTIVIFTSAQLRADTSASEELADCVYAGGDPLRIVGARRLESRCAATESGCKVTFKLALDDLGLAMSAEVYSLEPADPQLEPMWSRTGSQYVGKEFEAGPSHCLVHYVVEGSAAR